MLRWVILVYDYFAVGRVEGGVKGLALLLLS